MTRTHQGPHCLYQFQQAFSTPMVFAARVTAAIPTLVRGIVVPVEK